MSEEDDVKFESSEDEAELRKRSSNDKRLRDKVKESEAKAAEYLAGWQRAKADYINLQNQEAELRTATLNLGREQVLLDLIRLADSFDLAMANKTVWEEVPTNWRQGVEYIYKELQNIFQNYNLEVINPVGEEFDPVKHHAVEAVSGGKSGTVATVLQKGYKFGDKIIRPAQVKTYE